MKRQNCRCKTCNECQARRIEADRKIGRYLKNGNIAEIYERGLSRHLAYAT